MAAQHTAGPWEPVSLLRKPGEAKARLCVWRPLLASAGEYVGSEYMRDDSGNVLLFGALEDARTAIAKAEGSK